MAFSKDGKQLAVGTWDGELVLCDSQTGKVLKRLKEHRETITTLTFDGSGDYLASGSADDRLIVWDAASGEDLFTFHQGNEYDVTTCAFSPDGKRIVTGDGENQLKVWDAETGDELETLEGHHEPVTCVAWASDGRIVSGSWDDTVRIWKGGKVTTTLQGHRADVTGLALNSNASRVVSASEDKTLRIWNVASGALEAILHGHAEPIRCVAISPDDRLIVSGSNKEIRVWSLVR